MTGQDAESHPDLASFGEELRREREIRGISLKEIADSTKISRRFLEAIEKNDHRTLPAPVFTRGFVREYARYLGLSVDEIVNRYNFAAAGDDRIEQSAHLDRLATAVADREPSPFQKELRARRDIPHSYARMDRNVIGMILIVALLGAVTWWAVQQKQRRAAAAAAAEAPAEPRRATIEPATTAAAAPARAAAVPGRDAAGLQLVMSLTGDSWITLEVDGEQVLSEELSAGDQRTYQARDEFRFKTIGNAAGVDLTLNGLRIQKLGEEGAVIHDKVLNLDTLRPTRSRSDAPRTSS